MRFTLFAAITVFVSTAVCGATPTTLLDKGFSEMYGLQFDNAHVTFQEYARVRPEDPVGPAADAAAYLFTEFERLHILQSEFFTHDEDFARARKLQPDPMLKEKFEGSLARSQQLARNVLARAPLDVNATFATILCMGLHSDYAALIEKRYMSSLKEMKAGRALAEKLLAKDPTLYDAYLAVGVENYMLSLKPAPIRWLLRIGGARTDRDEGLKQLRLTAERGRYLRPFARLLLAVAAIRDKDRGRARTLLEGLAVDYPTNPLYRQELARLDQLARR